MRILVIVVTYNGEKWIEKCLSSIAPDLGIDGIVIDNGSTDKTLEIIKREFPYVKIENSEKNIGFGQANNVGFRYAIKENYDFVYLLNQDAWIAPRDILKLVEINNQYPEFGILSGLQVYKGKKRLDKDFLYSIPVDMINELVLHKDNKELYETDKIIPAAHWLLRTEVVKKIGGFSPIFIHFGEDNNLFDRNLFWKFKAGIVPSVMAVHDRELREPNKIFYERMLNGGLRFTVSDPNPSQSVPYIVLKYFIKYSRKIPWETIKVFFNVLVDMPNILKAKRISREPGAFL